MATKFYLPWGGPTPTPAPTVGTGWDITPSGFTRGVLTTVKTNTTNTAESSSLFGETSASVVNVVHRQFVSAPLVAQTISGTMNAVIKCGEDASTNDTSLQVIIRVVSDTGTTERGVLYAGHSAALNATAGALGQEFSTSSQTRLIPSGTALSSVVCVGGDRLVVEFGVRHHSTLTTNATDWLIYGDDAATDYALTAGLTTNLNPYITLSGNIGLSGVADPVGITDSVSVFAGAPVAKAPADPVGVTDSLAVFAGPPSYARSPADPVGITDSLAVTMNAVDVSQTATGFVGWGVPIR